MEESILYSLLHDVWGEGANDSLRLTMMRLHEDELVTLSLDELIEKLPEIPTNKWEIWKNYITEQRYRMREQLLNSLNVYIILYTDKEYPDKLRTVYRPPSILYVKGYLHFSSLCIGMVGSRKATPYGKNVAFSMAKSLSNEGVTIISGLAKGIDVNAHKGAIEGSTGTIAVLGCGIDKIYPRENAFMYDAIISHPKSAIISEWPLGAGAIAYHFPLRNRIISGLSDGVLVVEATAKSGSLITANYALEYGKEVFAIPGMITSAESVGCHRLLKDGAKLVAQPNDILEEFGQLCVFKETNKKVEQIPLSPQEQKILKVLSGVPQSIEDICIASKLPVEIVNGILVELELNDLVMQHFGHQYSLIES